MKRMYQYHVDVSRVIDGDTFVGTADLGMDVSIGNQRFRLLGVDTPEKKQDGFVEATEFTADLIEKQRVLVQSYGKDSFGRWLVDVFVEDHTKTLNELLLDADHAIEYMK